MNKVLNPTTGKFDLTGFDHVFLNFGDGSDGDVSVSTHITLTRSMFYNNLTVTSIGQITTNGYKIFVKGTITLASTGMIEANGVAATDINGATGVGSGDIGNTFSLGSSGGFGQISKGDAGGGTVIGTNIFYGLGPSGSGGNSGSGISAGNVGGTNSVSTVKSLRLFDPLINQGASLINFAMGGGGGAGGGGDSLTNAGGDGGGGGSGGGCVFIVARIIDLSGSIQAIGGKGGPGTDGTAVNCGGGGGGGAGASGAVILAYYDVIKDSASYDVSAQDGGSKGLAGGGISFDGVDGSPGSAGKIIKYDLKNGTVSVT